MHKYEIITVLPFSKYASPIFAQRKPNGKIRLPVELRNINTLIADDCTNKNHPVSTFSDKAQHLAGKSLFCKLDCSQAYLCLKMADQRSVEILAFLLLAEPLHTKNFRKVSADLCLLFQASCATTWTQLLKLTIVPNTWTILKLQPLVPRILPGIFGQSSSAFTRQD